MGGWVSGWVGVNKHGYVGISSYLHGMLFRA